MATANPFDLLVDDDNDDPSHLIAVQQQKIAAKKPTSAAAAPPPAAKLPSKPIPPAQAVRDSRSSTAPGRGGPAYGRGGRGAGIGSNRDFGDGSANGFSGGYRRSGGGEDGGGGGGGGGGGSGGNLEREGERGPPRQPFRGGRRGGYGNGEAEGDTERSPRRVFERRSGTGRGNEFKREGAGRGNWGTTADDVLAQETEENLNLEEKVVVLDKQPEKEDVPADVSNEDKERAAKEAEEKEKEDKEMTLEEYEKIREEKRKALLAMKSEERKVEVDKDLESLQQLSNKKANDEIFIKLHSDKDTGKKKENADREERIKKPVSINEFLKPAEGDRFYGRGRGRGRGPMRGGYVGGGPIAPSAPVPTIEDPRQFPTLGAK